MLKGNDTDTLLSLIRDQKTITRSQQILLMIKLSIPAILANMASIVMEYIDASMVGHLGATESASVGLVATSLWLLGGLLSVASTGFSVQVAHLIGANKNKSARKVLRQAFISTLIFSLIIGLIGVIISPFLPYWLKASSDVATDASKYFLIFTAFAPFLQMVFLCSGMFRCSGNIKLPSIINSSMCLLDVIFNFFLIFPTREYNIIGIQLTMPGAGLGVVGAAWGSAAAIFVSAILMICLLVMKDGPLKLIGEKGSFIPSFQCIKRAFTISFPMSIERCVMCGAQIMITTIVAPLGTIAIAANSFAITAESLCYMPGYGVSEATTAVIGQSIGACRRKLARHFANIAILLGVLVMAIMGALMFVFSTEMMQLITSHDEIVSLGSDILRIEAFAEPMFAAAIVCYGICVGTGKTLVPCIMNFSSLWGVRLILSFILAPTYGLIGVWVAMCIELCFRGTIFLIYILRGKWLPKQLETLKS